MMVISNVSAPASGANFFAIVASGSTWLIDMVSAYTTLLGKRVDQDFDKNNSIQIMWHHRRPEFQQGHALI
uniref:Uncharacterized protein n=1 Tax=Oryza nivara TaxID=4536 RepID=A0A0E0IJR1_ORYNI